VFSAPASGGDKIHENIAIELQQMWHDELGIQMDLRPLEAKIFYTAQAHLDFDLSRSSWIGDYDDRTRFWACSPVTTATTAPAGKTRNTTNSSGGQTRNLI